MNRLFKFCLCSAVLIAGLIFVAHAAESRSLRDAVRTYPNHIQTHPFPVDEFRADATTDWPLDTYNKKTTVSLRNTFISPNDEKAFVLVEMSDYSPNTVVVVIKCANKRGKSLEEPRVQTVLFRPDDALVRAVYCNIPNAKEGNVIAFSQAHVPDGAIAGERKAIATLTSKQAPTPKPKNVPRQPYQFMPQGKLVYDMNVSDVKIVDNEKIGSWSTSLSHGRTQPANPETGYYGTLKMGAIAKSDEKLLLKTKRLETPIDFQDGGRVYPYMSSVLSGRSMPETFFKYGSIEWEAKMPSQKGTWPALWLLPTTGWPPEIDVYEGFSHNSEWTQSVGLSSSIHGGKKNKRSFVRSSLRTQLNDFGLSGDLTQEVHKFQATISPGWITIFVDGVETMRFKNTFKGKTWYPIMTVAVRAKQNHDYETDTKDMEIHALKIWKVE